MRPRPSSVSIFRLGLCAAPLDSSRQGECSSYFAPAVCFPGDMGAISRRDAAETRSWEDVRQAVVHMCAQLLRTIDATASRTPRWFIYPRSNLFPAGLRASCTPSVHLLLFIAASSLPLARPRLSDNLCRKRLPIQSLVAPSRRAKAGERLRQNSHHQHPP